MPVFHPQIAGGLLRVDRWAFIVRKVTATGRLGVGVVLCGCCTSTALCTRVYTVHVGVRFSGLRLSALALQHASTDSTWQLDSPLLLPPSYRQSDTPNRSAPMALLSSILGFSLFGLGARIGQLGIQKRNLLESAFLPLLAFHQSSHISPKISFLTFFHPFSFFAFFCFLFRAPFLVVVGEQTPADTSSLCSLLAISVTGRINGTNAQRCSSPRNVRRSRSGVC